MVSQSGLGSCGGSAATVKAGLFREQADLKGGGDVRGPGGGVVCDVGTRAAPRGHEDSAPLMLFLFQQSYNNNKGTP